MTIPRPRDAEPDGPVDSTSDPEAGSEERTAAEMMRLLGEHVPLALLADLAERDGPPSPVILENEGLPEVAWWEPGSS